MLAHDQRIFFLGDFTYFSSHLVTVPPGPLLSEALVNSPVIVGEDGAGVAMQATGFEFGVDPNEDPELALVCISTSSAD